MSKQHLYSDQAILEFSREWLERHLECGFSCFFLFSKKKNFSKQVLGSVSVVAESPVEKFSCISLKAVCKNITRNNNKNGKRMKEYPGDQSNEVNGIMGQHSLINGFKR